MIFEEFEKKGYTIRTVGTAISHGTVNLETGMYERLDLTEDQTDVYYIIDKDGNELYETIDYDDMIEYIENMEG